MLSAETCPPTERVTKLSVPNPTGASQITLNIHVSHSIFFIFLYFFLIPSIADMLNVCAIEVTQGYIFYECRTWAKVLSSAVLVKFNIFIFFILNFSYNNKCVKIHCNTSRCSSRPCCRCHTGYSWRFVNTNKL
jgi:hypothetical protein